MAIIIPGVAISQASGRVGGTIFSRNRGGAYIRNGSKPSVVTTPYAQTIKAILANFSAQWQDLTAEQREAWTEWATQNPITNRLGQQRTLSGHGAFVQINARLAAAGGASLTDPRLASHLTASYPAALPLRQPLWLFRLPLTADPPQKTLRFRSSPT